MMQKQCLLEHLHQYLICIQNMQQLYYSPFSTIHTWKSNIPAFPSYSMNMIAKQLKQEMRRNVRPEVEQLETQQVYDFIIELWNDKIMNKLEYDERYKWIIEYGLNNKWIFWGSILTEEGPVWWPCVIHILFGSNAFCELINISDDDDDMKNRCLVIDYEYINTFKLFECFKLQSDETFMKSDDTQLEQRWIDS
eukprot:21275_1